MATADTARLVAELSLNDKGFTKGLSNAEKKLGSLEKTLGKTARNVGKVAAIGVAGATGAIVASVNAAADYEQAFAGVRKTVDATESQLLALSDAFRDMSKEIPISASELAALGEAGGALGVKTESLEEFVRVTALLGQTTDITAQDAATSLGVLSNVLGLTSDEYSQFASSLVALGNAGASTESQIIDVAERIGATGELIGLSTEQVLGFSSAVASLGIESEAGGTSLQKLFIDTTKFVSEAGDELKVLAKTSGKSTKTFKANFEKNAGAAIQDFLAGLGKLDKAAQLNALDELGFTDARITRTILGLAGATELVSSQMTIANDAFEKNTALSKEAGERNKTFSSQLGILKNTITDAGITIGTALLPQLTTMAKRLSQLIDENGPAIQDFANKLPGAFDKAVAFAEKIPWGTIASGLESATMWAGKLFDVFLGLPPEVQTTIIALGALNKLSGGAITGIVGELGKGLIKGVLGMNAGVVNINAATVNGVGGPGGATGSAGRGSSLGATALTGAAVLGAAQEIGSAIGEEVAKSQGANDTQARAFGDIISGVFGPIIPTIQNIESDRKSVV